MVDQLDRRLYGSRHDSESEPFLTIQHILKLLDRPIGGCGIFLEPLLLLLDAVEAVVELFNATF